MSLPVLTGAVLATIGFLLALVSLALPWASYRVLVDLPGQGGGAQALESSGGIAVFQLARGPWYVTLLFAVLGLLLGAAAAADRKARASGIAALLLAVAAMLVTTMLRNGAGSAATEVAGVLGTVDLRTSAGPGSGYALVALPLLGLSAALLSVRTPGSGRATNDGAAPHDPGVSDGRGWA